MHAAFGAVAGGVGDDFRVHGAGELRVGRCAWRGNVGGFIILAAATDGQEQSNRGGENDEGSNDGFQWIFD